MSIDKGRWLICSEIAREYPEYETQAIYEVYTRLFEHKEATGQKIYFGTHMADVKRALLFARENGISPMEAAKNLYELPEEEDDGTETAE